MDSLFDMEKFNKIVLRIEELMEDYKVLKSDLNYYTKKLENLYNDDGSPSLDFLYDVEDKQFSKCIDAVCVYQDIVSLFNRLEENEQTRFVLNRLEKQIMNLSIIESHFYFDYVEEEFPEKK